MAQEHLEKFVKQLGVRDEIISTLKAEELDPEFDMNVTIQTIRDEQKSLHLNELRNDYLSKADHQKEVDRHKIASTNKHKEQLSDKFELGLSRSASKGMTVDEVWNLVNDKMEASKTPPDESEYKIKVEEWVKKYQELDTNMNELVTKHEEDVSGLKLEFENKRMSNAVNKMLTDKLNDVDWARPKQKHIDLEWVKNKLLEKYDIFETEIIVDKNGGTVATPFEGASPYRNVDEAITYLVKKNQLDAQSNGNKDVPALFNGVPIANNKLSDSTKAMHARIEGN